MTSAESAQAAKQLDSVTDRVQETTELDTTKAKEAMNSISNASAVKLSQIRVSRDDIDVCMQQLEVTEDQAIRALQQASLEMHQQAGGESVAAGSSDVVLKGALRKLLYSVPGGRGLQ